MCSLLVALYWSGNCIMENNLLKWKLKTFLFSKRIEQINMNAESKLEPQCIGQMETIHCAVFYSRQFDG